MPSFPGGVGITIGVPSDGKPVAVEWAFGLQNLHVPTNFETRWAFIKGAPVAEAREAIADIALANNAKFLFFLGTDVTVPAHCIRQLIFHLEHYPKYAIAGGIYVQKNPPQEPLVYRGNGRGPYWDWKVGEVFEVTGIGMDATLIRVDALRDIQKPFFKTVDSVEKSYEGKNAAEYWTEDLYLCKKLQDKGWKIMADGGVLCQHWDNARGISYSLPANSKPWRRLAPVGDKKVVDLGCGPKDHSYSTNEGEVVRVDVREEVEPDYRCDLRKLPFGDGSFDVVYSSHTLEHFNRKDINLVLDEIRRILKEDGELRLVVPNLEWAAKIICNGEFNTDVMNVLYGEQDYEHNYHYMGFVPKVLEQMLVARGFVKFDWQHVAYHMYVRAWIKEPAEVPIITPTPTAVADNGGVCGKSIYYSKTPADFVSTGIEGSVELVNGPVDKIEDDKPSEETPSEVPA